MNNQKTKQQQVTDEHLSSLEKKGVEFISVMRGNKICCQKNSNIEFIDKDVDGTFNPNNPDHLAYLTENLQPCFCHGCGSKYWAHLDLSDKKFISRV